LVIDHLCRIKACVRHLEAVPSRTNTLRGDTIPAKHHAKEACVRGHPFNEANTYWRPDGTHPRRGCRACARERERERKRRRRP
jgi:hypothetical protein